MTVTVTGTVSGALSYVFAVPGSRSTACGRSRCAPSGCSPGRRSRCSRSRTDTGGILPVEAYLRARLGAVVEQAPRRASGDGGGGRLPYGWRARGGTLRLVGNGRARRRRLLGRRSREGVGGQRRKDTGGSHSAGDGGAGHPGHAAQPGIPTRNRFGSHDPHGEPAVRVPPEGKLRPSPECSGPGRRSLQLAHSQLTAKPERHTRPCEHVRLREASG